MLFFSFLEKKRVFFTKPETRLIITVDSVEKTEFC